MAWLTAATQAGKTDRTLTMFPGEYVEGLTGEWCWIQGNNRMLWRVFYEPLRKTYRVEYLLIVPASVLTEQADGTMLLNMGLQVKTGTHWDATVACRPDGCWATMKEISVHTTYAGEEGDKRAKYGLLKVEKAPGMLRLHCPDYGRLLQAAEPAVPYEKAFKLFTGPVDEGFWAVLKDEKICPPDEVIALRRVTREKTTREPQNALQTEAGKENCRVERDETGFGIKVLCEVAEEGRLWTMDFRIHVAGELADGISSVDFAYDRPLREELLQKLAAHIQKRTVKRFLADAEPEKLQETIRAVLSRWIKLREVRLEECLAG